MERLADDTIESFMNAIEERLAEGQKNKIPFSRFLEEKMDAFDYSNTSLAKKVFHRVEKKNTSFCQMPKKHRFCPILIKPYKNPNAFFIAQISILY